MSSFLNTQTPSIVKNRYGKNNNGLSANSLSFSQQQQQQSTAASKFQYNNNSFTLTPNQQQQQMRNNNNGYQNVSFDNTNQYKSPLLQNQTQRYFADSLQRDNNNRNEYKLSSNTNGYMIQSNNNNYNNINNNVRAMDEQNRVYNTVLLNQSQQTTPLLNNQSLSQQINNQYLQNKTTTAALLHPANSILTKGINNSMQINSMKQQQLLRDQTPIATQSYLEREQEQLSKNMRSIQSIREQGFLQQQQNEILLHDGQTFVRSRKILLDILIAIIVIMFAYVLYRINCLLLNQRFQLFDEIKYITALCISIFAKLSTFNHKMEVNSSFISWVLIGFAVDCLATQYCIGEVVNVFFIQKLNMDIRLKYKENYLICMSLICTLFYYQRTRYIENNNITNVNREIRTIVRETFSEIFSKNIFDYIKISLLPILFTLTIMFLNGERYSTIFLNRADYYNTTFTAAFLNVYLLTLTQILLFIIITELIVNLKSLFIWNFLSEIHDVHQVQHFYFILADQKLNDQFLELKTLKFLQANFNNKQKVNILKNINIEGQPIQVWNVMIRHGLYLKNRLNNSKMENMNKFENVYELEQRCPKQFIHKMIFYITHAKFFLNSFSAYKDIVFLFEMSLYSIQNLTNTLLAYKHIQEYHDLFNQVYSQQVIAEYMQSVFQDLIEVQRYVQNDKKLSEIYRQLLCNMSILQDMSQKEDKLFNGTIQTILSKPESFYTS